ncbi:hypothetical protein GQ55_2G040800 [Panicum hallii var. hallii]|uniref:Uncharacterized protein n=1 Tax=Panicum hallii var. hallii TaxID=1504633 RepID=A0A2T7ELA2_9POAL|nr:hypothetical protein GQ55_2G040800 [Panicum hallii var. hallii]
MSQELNGFGAAGFDGFEMNTRGSSHQSHKEKHRTDNN